MKINESALFNLLESPTGAVGLFMDMKAEEIVERAQRASAQHLGQRTRSWQMPWQIRSIASGSLTEAS